MLTEVMSARRSPDLESIIGTGVPPARCKAGWHSLQGAHMPADIQMPVYGNHEFGRKSEIKWTLPMAKWIYKRGHVYDNILPQEERRTDAGNRAL
jgi:hypothetical protein